MFTVTAIEGYKIDLTLQDASSGTQATRTGFTYQYSTDGSTWTTYSWNGSTGDQPTVPASGKVYVRVNITSEADASYEGAETFALKASYTTNTSKTAAANSTIVDDGSGTKYDGTVTSGTPAGSTSGLDDDRAMSVANDTGTLTQNTTLTISAANGLLSNDRAEGTKTLRVESFTIAGTQYVIAPGSSRSATIAEVGTLTINSDGSYTFVPVLGYAGPVPSITYTARDSNGQSATATLSLTVTAIDPIAVADSFSTPAGTPVTIPILTNDTRVAGSRLRVSQIDGRPITPGVPFIVNGGSVVVDSSGELTFTPTDGFSGTPSFSYTITDQNGRSSTAAVSGTVLPPPPPAIPPTVAPPVVVATTTAPAPVSTPTVPVTVIAAINPPVSSSGGTTATTTLVNTAGTTGTGDRGFQPYVGPRAADGSALLTAGKIVPPIEVGSGPITFTVPQEAFLHSDPNAVVTLTASTLDNQPIPSWISFDPVTGTFTAVPPPGLSGEVILRVVAKDQFGQQAVQEVKFVVKSGQRSDVIKPTGPKSAEFQKAFRSFSQQIREASAIGPLSRSARS